MVVNWTEVKVWYPAVNYFCHVMARWYELIMTSNQDATRNQTKSRYQSKSKSEVNIASGVKAASTSHIQCIVSLICNRDLKVRTADGPGCLSMT